MVIRKLTLSEWFLQHQLKQIQKKSCHIPMVLKANITKTTRQLKQNNKRLPINAIVLKALGKTASQYPHLNRMLFKTLIGYRFLETQEIRVNFPIEIQHDGQSITSAIVIHNPHLKTVAQIHDEIRAAKNRPLNSFPVTQFVYTKNNNFINRLILRCLFAWLTSSPHFYFKRGGGGLSFSSLTHIQNQNMLITPVSFGPTGLTICVNTIEESEGQTFLHLGIGFNHLCHSGSEMAKMLEAFTRNLNEMDEGLLS